MDGSASQQAGRRAVLSRGNSECSGFSWVLSHCRWGPSLSFLSVSQPSCQLLPLDQRWSHNLAFAGLAALGSRVFGVSGTCEEGTSDPPGGSLHLCVNLYLAEGEEGSAWSCLVQSSRASLSRML